jgi:hypothetical protein
MKPKEAFQGTDTETAHFSGFRTTNRFLFNKRLKKLLIMRGFDPRSAPTPRQRVRPGLTGACVGVDILQQLL